MEALDKAIEEKNSRLNSIEESEDMKELVDKKAMKELKKEVKLLEKYKGKVLKMYKKLTKTKKKEIIDEDEIIDEGETQDTLDASEKTPNDISGKKTFNDFYEEAEKEMGLPRGANNQGAHDLAYMRWKQYKEDNNIQEVEDKIIEKEINEGPKEDSSSEIKTNWEEIKKIVDDIEKTDLFEEDENMPSKDKAEEMKAELESYLYKWKCRRTDLDIENHPEDIIHKTFLLRIAKMAVFDEEVE
jgi:hypothetical protein